MCKNYTWERRSLEDKPEAFIWAVGPGEKTRNGKFKHNLIPWLTKGPKLTRQLGEHSQKNIEEHFQATVQCTGQQVTSSWSSLYGRNVSYLLSVGLFIKVASKYVCVQDNEWKAGSNPWLTTTSSIDQNSKFCCQGCFALSQFLSQGGWRGNL